MEWSGQCVKKVNRQLCMLTQQVLKFTEILGDLSGRTRILTLLQFSDELWHLKVKHFVLKISKVNTIHLPAMMERSYGRL